MVRRLLLSLVALVALVAAPTAAHAAPTLPAGFSTVTVAKSLWDATAFAYTPDGRRVFVVEKRGRVAVVHPGVSQTPKTVLDLEGKVAVNGDRGMLGIAVDPAFATNGWVYLLYTYDDGSALTAPKTARLTRIKVNPDDTLASPLNPETVLLGSIGVAPCPAPANTVDCIPSNSNSHSIGTVRAAADGTLWVGSGDGQNYNAMDPAALRTYDERSMSGKILHIDRNGRGLPGHPFCPGEANLDLVCTKLFAKGFRNPFRFQLREGTGPVVGDVGWETSEEIDLTESGRSYGWPCWEGADPTPDYEELADCQPHYATSNPPESGPAYSYPHNPGGAVVVGPQYTATRYPPAWRNAWFAGDFVQGWLRAYDIVGGKIQNVRTFAAEGFEGVDLELTPEGDLAYITLSDNGVYQTGELRRIVFGNAPPPAVAHADPAAGSAPLSVDFSADESIDPDGDAVTYEWDFGDGSSATGRTPTHVYADTGLYTATLTVRDARGLASEDDVQVRVGVTAPVATIASPPAGFRFRHGIPVQLRGSAVDLEEGELSGDQLAWRIVLHHGSHIHLAGDNLHGKEQTFIPAGDHDADSYYEVFLTATDASDDSNTARVEIRPQTIPLTLASSPPGVPLSYSGREQLTPITLNSAIGYRTSVSAPASVTRDGITRAFERWSDGGARQHPIVIPATAATLTAIYATPPAGGVTGERESAPAAKRARLRLDRARRGARTLSGRITGLATAPRVRVALRTARSRGICRHWHAGRRGGLGRRVTRCSSHVWMRATVTPAGASTWRWRVRLRGALKRGRYVVATRVTNKRGRQLVSGAPLRLRVR